MPVPPVKLLGHLQLPATRLAATAQGFINDFFGGAFYWTGSPVAGPAWSNKSLKAADRDLWPLLYTPGYLATNEYKPPFFTAGSQILLAPTIGFGQPNTRVRLPRAIVLGLRRMPAGKGGVTSWINANAGWIQANNIYVVSTFPPITNGYWLMASGQPIAGAYVNPPNTFGDTIAGATLDPTTFLAGECFELPFLQILSSGGEYYGGGGEFFDSLAQNDVANQVAAYPRYARRTVQGWAHVGTDPDNAFAYNQALAGQLTSYGYQPLVNVGLTISDSVALSFLNSQTAAIKAFFGVGP